MDAELRCHDLTLYDDIAKWTLAYDVMVHNHGLECCSLFGCLLKSKGSVH